MKLFSNGEMKDRTISNIIVIISGILVFAFFLRFQDLLGFVKNLLKILMPFFVGFTTAFVVAAPMSKLESLFLKLKMIRKRPKMARIVSIVICYILLFALILAFIGMVVPQLIDSIRILSVNASNFIRSHTEEINELLKMLNLTGDETQNVLFTWETITAKSLEYAGKALVSIASMSVGISNVVIQLFIGLVLSIYMLFGKEMFAAQGKKLAFAFLKKNVAAKLIYWMRRTHAIFSGFIAGKIIETVIVGGLCYIGMMAMRLEFPVLIAVIVGITNIVPIFGPWIGAIISALILLIVNPWSALWFLIFVIVLQQIDANIIGPRVLGDSTGLSPFWTVMSIVIGGGFFGIMGMLISIPVFALIYAIARTVVAVRLQAKGLPTKTKEYYGKNMAFSPPVEPVEDEASPAPQKKQGHPPRTSKRK